MKRIDQRNDVVFNAVDLANGEMARDLLADRGIPSMLHSHGLEADATMGLSGIYYLLLVPLGRGAEARRVLEEVWGTAAVEKLEPSRVERGSIPAGSDAGDQP